MLVKNKKKITLKSSKKCPLNGYGQIQRALLAHHSVYYIIILLVTK